MSEPSADDGVIVIVIVKPGVPFRPIAVCSDPVDAALLCQISSGAGGFNTVMIHCQMDGTPVMWMEPKDGTDIYPVVDDDWINETVGGLQMLKRAVELWLTGQQSYKHN